MIHRLISFPLSKDNFEEELRLIKQIAVNNGYKPKIIDNILQKKLFKKTINLVYPTSTNKKCNFKTLTYIGTPTKKISHFLSKQNLSIAYKTNNKLSMFIKNNKEKTEKDKKSGVYKLTCGTCDKCYIGQTGRTFKTRISEHLKSYQQKKQDSTYANHLLEENHLPSPEFKILHVENKGLKLNLLESLEINKIKNCNKNIILNDQLEINMSPLLNLF